MAIKDLFLKLTSTTTPHGHESLMEPYMPKGWKNDTHGNYYYTIGDNFTTMFTCHLDTADTGSPKPIKHVIEGKIIKTDQTTILGGDDKSGAAIMIYMIGKKVPGLYYFFLGEERGCIGSRALARQLESKKDGVYENITKVIAFDRKGTDSVITFQMGERNCSDEFADDLAKRLNEAGGFKFIKDQGGLVTDSHHFAGLIPECTNLSTGYEDQHYIREKQDIEFLQKLADACCKIDWETIAVKRDPTKVEKRSYYSSGSSSYNNRNARYHEWDNYGANDWWDQRSQQQQRVSSTLGPQQLPPGTEFVTDYLGNKIKFADAQWCPYDKQWCLKSEAIWEDYIGFFVCPDFDPAKVKKEPVVTSGGGERTPITDKDVKVGLELYTEEGELFGKVDEFDDKITVKTTEGSRFIMPMDKFLSYNFTKKSESVAGTKKLTDKDLKVGLVVYHNIFGKGKIKEIRADRTIVKVAFDTQGDKNMRLDVADMKV